MYIFFSLLCLNRNKKHDISLYENQIPLRKHEIRACERNTRKTLDILLNEEIQSLLVDYVWFSGNATRCNWDLKYTENLDILYRNERYSYDERSIQVRTRDNGRMDKTAAFIEDYERKYDRIPSYRTILKECGYGSMTTLYSDIKRLKEADILGVDELGRLRLSRREGIKKLTAMVVGGIRCGTPTDPTEDTQETVELPPVLFGEDYNRVIMKAEGDSMTGKGIYDGDWLIVKKQPTANVGDVVAAMMANGEYTCKTLRHDEKGYYLEAANPDYTLIRPTEDWFIYGVVQQVIHKV